MKFFNKKQIGIENIKNARDLDDILKHSIDFEPDYNSDNTDYEIDIDGTIIRKPYFELEKM